MGEDRTVSSSISFNFWPSWLNITTLYNGVMVCQLIAFYAFTWQTSYRAQWLNCFYSAYSCFAPANQFETQITNSCYVWINQCHSLFFKPLLHHSKNRMAVSLWLGKVSGCQMISLNSFVVGDRLQVIAATSLDCRRTAQVTSLEQRVFKSFVKQ